MLTLIATPIGDPNDLSIRALEAFKKADVVICESTKETSTLLKFHGIKVAQYEVLSEHSKAEELNHLIQLCENKNVVLVSDCGTPGFCDPGANLVRLCQKRKIPFTSLLGPSALMGLISMCGERLDQFLFRGFLPAENEARARSWAELRSLRKSVILMDTPYRLKKMLSEAQQHLPDRECVLTINLSQPDETLLRGTAGAVLEQLKFDKAEFMLLILAPSHKVEA